MTDETATGKIAVRSLPIWADGHVIWPETSPSAASAEMPVGCYTTARVHADRSKTQPCADWEARHVERLRRDTETLGLGRLRPEWIPRAFRELAAAAFGTGEGIVRLDAHAGANGEVHVTGTPREIGPNPAVWTACLSTIRHRGAHAWSRVKLCADPDLARARTERSQTEADEALLVDAAGYLIEGTRTNLVVINASGEALTPDLDRGGVQGIAYDLVRERIPEVRRRSIPALHLRSARELIAINSVRGARAIVELDGIPIGTGRSGPWADRITKILSSA